MNILFVLVKSVLLRTCYKKMLFTFWTEFRYTLSLLFGSVLWMGSSFFHTTCCNKNTFLFKSCVCLFGAKIINKVHEMSCGKCFINIESIPGRFFFIQFAINSPRFKQVKETCTCIWCLAPTVPMNSVLNIRNFDRNFNKKTDIQK